MLFRSFLCCVSILPFTAFASPVELLSTPALEKRSSHGQTENSRLEARDALDLRVVIIGASIARGYGSTDGNGFRAGLRTGLAKPNNKVTMVGTQRAGNMFDNQCEAYEGRRIDEVTANVKRNLPQFKPGPNIALIHLGSNDISQKFETWTMHERISGLIDYVCKTLPEAHVFVSTLLPNTEIEAGIVEYNKKLRTVVDSQRKLGRRVYLADVHTSELTPGDMYDSIHPNNNGYAKMANIYSRVILDVLQSLGSNPLAIVPAIRTAQPVLDTSTNTTNTTSGPTLSTPIPLPTYVQGGAGSIYRQPRSGSVAGSMILQLSLILACAVPLLT